VSLLSPIDAGTFYRRALGDRGASLSGISTYETEQAG
jgi:hypothetical protein